MTLLTHTPIWVWLILVFLLIVGFRQLKSRNIRLFQALIAPMIFALLLIIGILKTPFPLMGIVMLVAGVLIGVVLGGLKFRHSPLLMSSNTIGYWHQRGSAIPLAVYLYIFITRYVANALPHFSIASLPDYAPNVVVGFTGIGMGVLLAIVIFRQNHVD